jgi:hypothetical protein
VDGGHPTCLLALPLTHFSMIRNSRTRRFLSVLLVILGGVLMFLAPENIWIGAVFFGLGAGVEIAGLALGHRK